MQMLSFTGRALAGVLTLIGGYCSPLTCNPALLEPLPRFSALSITRAELVRRLHNGDSFVLTGLNATGFSPQLFAWGTCPALGAHPDFKDVEVRQEYTDDKSGHQWRRLENLLDGTLGQSPYYWAVREPAEAEPEQRREDPSSSETWDERRYDLVQDMVDGGGVLPERMVDNMKGRGEVWLGFPGGGAKAHMDSHTDSTVSIQLSGRKLWTVLPSVPNRSAAHARKIFVDGMCATRGQWPVKGARQGVLKPGDAIFFPPGTIHETCGLDSEQPLGCGVSITFQFSAPYPWSFIRTNLKSILLTPDLEGFHGMLHRMIQKKSPRILDTNNDSVVSPREVRQAELVVAEVNALLREIPRSVKLAVEMLREDHDDGPTVLQDWEANAWRRELKLLKSVEVDEVAIESHGKVLGTSWSAQDEV